MSNREILDKFRRAVNDGAAVWFVQREIDDVILREPTADKPWEVAGGARVWAWLQTVAPQATQVWYIGGGNNA